MKSTQQKAEQEASLLSIRVAKIRHAGHDEPDALIVAELTKALLPLYSAQEERDRLQGSVIEAATLIQEFVERVKLLEQANATANELLGQQADENDKINSKLRSENEALREVVKVIVKEHSGYGTTDDCPTCKALAALYAKGVEV